MIKGTVNLTREELSILMNSLARQNNPAQNDLWQILNQTYLWVKERETIAERRNTLVEICKGCAHMNDPALLADYLLSKGVDVKKDAKEGPWVRFGGARPQPDKEVRVKLYNEDGHSPSAPAIWDAVRRLWVAHNGVTHGTHPDDIWQYV